MQPFVPLKAAWVYGKADGPFHPRGPAGGRLALAMTGARVAMESSEHVALVSSRH